LATEQELSDFLKSVERRAFKRSVYHVRDEEAALDIVQDSMMKLAQHYGDKPPNELPMLFQRILSNCTLDWFRRQKTRRAFFSNMSDFDSVDEDGDFDLLENFVSSLTNSRRYGERRRCHERPRPGIARDRSCR
jgi:RNA polymerase sigma-70 factor (ECF subfamily)